MLLRRPDHVRKKTCPELSRADSSGRYAVGGHIIARIGAARQGTLREGAVYGVAARHHGVRTGSTGIHSDL
ncbi:hypothetical protein GCM10018775_85770 [Streptomyces umbrinus]|nr:hypothetical protein GCM10018775_85770 [Streptomyces umbrinus]